MHLRYNIHTIRPSNFRPTNDTNTDTSKTNSAFCIFRDRCILRFSGITTLFKTGQLVDLSKNHFIRNHRSIVLNLDLPKGKILPVLAIVIQFEVSVSMCAFVIEIARHGLVHKGFNISLLSCMDIYR